MTLMCSEPEAPGACWATGCWSRQRWGPTCAALPSATCGSWTQLAGCGWNGPGAQVRAQERKLLTIDVDSTICETFARVRQAGARGPVTLRADSGFYSKKVLLACRRAGVRFSVTVRQDQAAQRMIPAIPETARVPIPY